MGLSLLTFNLTLEVLGVKLGLSVTGDLAHVTVKVLFDASLGLFSVVETVRLDLDPPTGLGDATLAVVRL